MRNLKFVLLMITSLTAASAGAEPIKHADTAAQAGKNAEFDEERARQAEQDARRQMEISRIEAAGSAQRAPPDNSRIRAEQKARAAALEAAQRRAAAERAAAAREAAEREEKSKAESRSKAQAPKQSSRPTRDLGVDQDEAGSVSRIEAPGSAPDQREKP